jgi:hypothetical protein
MQRKRATATFPIVISSAIVISLVGSSFAAQAQSKHEPDFALTISAKGGSVTTQNHADVIVNVEEKNISNHIINVGRPVDPASWYAMSVLLGSNPAPFTEEGKRRLIPKPYNPTSPITIETFMASLKPGQAQNFSVPLTAYFDLNSPGQYQVTFSRGTDQGQPDNVIVKSNTITITVLPADDTPPPSNNSQPSTSSPTVSHTVSSENGRALGGATVRNLTLITQKPQPAFSLSIEADKTVTSTDPSLRRLLVTFTNVSPGAIINQFHPEAENMYNMVVSRNGVPVKETDAMRALEQYREVDRYPTIEHPFILKAGQSLTTALDVSDYYDMTQPGAYTITVTRQSQPLNPAYSTLVSSNTLVINVPQSEANAAAPPKPQPRFDLNISTEDPDEVPPTTIRVEMENTSNSVIRQAKCWPFLGMFNFVVTRDNQPVPESDEMLALQKSRAAVTCPGNDTLIEIKPGDFYAEDIPIGNFYDISQPGVYEVHVTRETAPWNPAKSVTVESNPVTFQVPRQAASDTNRSE